MPTLPSLFKKINHFYRLAALQSQAQQGYVMPDDPEEGDDFSAPDPDQGWYPNLIKAAQQIRDPNTAAEIQLIAALYNRALELKAGYNYVNKAISNFINLIDEDDQGEQSSVEALLNEVSRDLRNRMKAPGGAVESPAILQAFKQTKDDFERQMREAAEVESDEPSAYEAGLTGYQESEEGVKPGLTQYEEGAEGVFDPTGGVSGEVAATKGRGYRIERRSYKDWVKSFENERDRYVHEKDAPELQVSTTGVEARRNAAARNNLEELVTLLGQMIELTKEAVRLENELQAAPDPANQTKLEQIREVLKNFQKRRLALKQNLRNHTLTQQRKELEGEAATARTPQEKFLIEKRIQLQNLMMSPDVGKGEESKWLRVLINSISEGRSIPADQVAKLEAKIQEGAAKKKKATDLWKQRAQQVAALKGTVGPAQTNKKRMQGQVNEYNLSIVPLEGLVEHLTQRLATERVVVKQKVTDKMKKAKQDPGALKPFMDDVAKAATKKDRAALLTAAQRLKQKMEEYKNVLPEVVGYVISLRTSKFFYEFRDMIKNISKMVEGPLDAKQLSEINAAIIAGNKLASYYKNLKIKPINPAELPRSTHYKSPVEMIENIVQRLEGLKS